MTQTITARFILLALGLILAGPATGQTGEPSRVADEGCTWEKLAGAEIGLSAWVERCDFGFRQIDLHVQGNAVVEKFSDSPDADPVIQVFDLTDGETAEDGLRRIYEAQTDPAIAGRCVLAPSTLTTPPAGVQRFGFVPDQAYAAELVESAVPDEVPQPACGEFGDGPEGIQYFEVQANARKVLFVVEGQDLPLFDADTLRIDTP